MEGEWWLLDRLIRAVDGAEQREPSVSALAGDMVEVVGRFSLFALPLFSPLFGK